MASPGARVVVAFLGGRTAFGLSFLVASARKLPSLWYLPLQRSIVFGPKPGAFVMEWYGRCLTSGLVAALVTAALWLFSARRPLGPALEKGSFVRSLAQAAALALLLDFSYFGWVLLTQLPSPLPLPPGCVP